MYQTLRHNKLFDILTCFENSETDRNTHSHTNRACTKLKIEYFFYRTFIKRKMWRDFVFASLVLILLVSRRKNSAISFD